MKKFLKKGERIVTAYAEAAWGPGWANRPLWVIVCDQNQSLRRECIQPEDQNHEINTLYSVSQAAHMSMTGAVDRLLARSKKK